MIEFDAMQFYVTGFSQNALSWILSSQSRVVEYDQRASRNIEIWD